MRKDDFPEFTALLDDAYAFQRESLSPRAKALFFAALSQHSLPDVKAAILAHMRDPKVGKFAIQPADVIAQLQGMAGNDGRPGAEEAWAIALTSRDEAATVVWTQEIAEAFGICQPVLQTGDEVGARMAFKEAYQRLVTEARADAKPAQWSASLGWDVELRTEVLTKAAGLLPAPTVAALLPPPPVDASDDEHAKAQLSRIKEMLAGMGNEKARERELHAQREREATAAAKAGIAEQVDSYQRRVA